MGIINVLDISVANLIAAGEVVDRPASVVKELFENSVDAGAMKITVEIQHGGITFIRVTDNGCGIEKEDLPLAILRHATSKIATAEDLAEIGTLGFRGEALAAISSVSKTRIMSKTPEYEMGAVIACEGGVITDACECGSAAGTSVIVEELFFNVPARRKFLKKDNTEAAAVTGTVEKLALSVPSVSVRYISDGETKFTTAGDGKLWSAVYAVYGKDVAKRLVPVDRSDGGIRVYGYVSAPDFLRANRNMENFFINGRFVRSRTVMAALEQAYESHIPKDKFPFCVLNLELNPSAVDVNVHPAKLEVKFSNERVIYEAVYYAVMSALSRFDSRPEFVISGNDTADMTDTAAILEAVKNGAASVAKSGGLTIQSFLKKPDESVPWTASPATDTAKTVSTSPSVRDDAPVIPHTTDMYDSRRAYEEKAAKTASATVSPDEVVNMVRSQISIAEPQKSDTEGTEQTDDKPRVPHYTIIGEAYNCYIIVELDDRIMLIDKHAAHERIIFDELCARLKSNAKYGQILMFPIKVTLTEAELDTLETYGEEIRKTGFEWSVTADKACEITQIPEIISRESAADMFTTITGELAEGTGTVTAVETQFFERSLYRASCKAAIKGGRVYGDAHLKWICDRLLTEPDADGKCVKTCPHGRPVAFEIKKSSIERQFSRTT